MSKTGKIVCMEPERVNVLLKLLTPVDSVQYLKKSIFSSIINNAC